MREKIVAEMKTRFPQARLFQERHQLPIPDSILWPIGSIPTTTWLDTQVDGVRVKAFPTVMNSRHTLERLFIPDREFMTLLPGLVHPVPEDQDTMHSVMVQDGVSGTATLNYRSAVEEYLPVFVREIAQEVTDLDCEIKIATAEQLLTVFITLLKAGDYCPIEHVRTLNFSGAGFYLDVRVVEWTTIVFDENPGSLIFGSYVVPIMIAKG